MDYGGRNSQRHTRSARDDDDGRGRSSSRRPRDDDEGTARRGASSTFKYQSRDPEKVKSRAEHGGGSNDSYLKDVVRLFKPAEGPNDIRFLPPTWDGADHYGLDISVHYGIGPDNAAYLCLQKMKNKPCPVCDERKRAVAEGDMEYADELRPSQRVISYVFDRTRPREGALAWSISKRMDQDILRLCVDPKTGDTLEIDHPEDGYDLSFSREGQGLKTRYNGLQIARRSSPLDDDKALDFVQANPLPDQLIFYSYDHIASMFSGKAKGKDDDAPAPTRGRDDDKPAVSRRRDVGRLPEKDDDAPSRARGRAAPVAFTWTEIHALGFRQLAALIDEERLDIDPDASRDDDELADQVCEALDIEETRAPARSRGADGGRRKLKDDDDDDDVPIDPRRERMREAQRGGR